MEAEAEEGFGGGGSERQQTAEPAGERVGEPGVENSRWLGEVATAAWQGSASSC